jgi:hypothetical protein
MNVTWKRSTPMSLKLFMSLYQNRTTGKYFGHCSKYHSVIFEFWICASLFSSKSTYWLKLHFILFLQIWKDCGVHLMKNITLFKPRNNMMGTYSHLDMPNIRIQIANDMMFSEFNESKEMQQAVRDFKPTVRFKASFFCKNVCQ